MKRGNYVLISVILVLLLAITSSYSYAQDIYVQPSETDTSVGELFSVDIMVRDITGLSTFELRVLFNKDVLEGVSLTRGSLWNDPDYLWHAGSIDNTSGTIGFTSGAASSGSEPFGINVDSNGGALATITFQAIAKGTSTIGLTDVLIYDVDGNGISVNAIDGTVNSVNRQPVADDQSVTTNEDTPVGITLTGSDPDGDPITYTMVNNPSNGSLSGTAPDLTYTPNAGYSGDDSFTFKVNDGTVDSNIATVSITVDSVNDPPVADDQSVNTNEDTPVDITLTGSDPDGDTLIYTVVSNPSNGSLNGTAPSLTYIPNPNHNSSDSFTFKVNDGKVDSNIATVSITVNPVNDPPVADDQSVSTDEDASVNITLTGSDPDGDPLTYTVVSNPSNGSLSGTAPDMTYTPDPDHNSSDSFTFKVNDGTVDSDIATVSITVNPVNDPPVADDQSVSTDEDTSVNITLTGSDPDGDPLIYHIVSNPSNGLLSGTAPNLTYTPDANFYGNDSFAFKVDDGTVDSNSATVSIIVEPAGIPVSIPPAAGPPGGTVNVPIRIGDTTGAGVIGVDLTVTYDASILTATVATTLETIAEPWGAPTYNITPGQIIVMMAGAMPLNGTGDLLDISFSVASTASIGSTSDLMLTIVELNENTIPVTLQNGLFTVMEPRYGDVSGDGSVSAYDAALVLQYAAGLITFTPLQLAAGDVSGNGTVSSYDAGLILQYAAGIIDKFPVEQDQPGGAATNVLAVEITAPDLNGHAGDDITVPITIGDVTDLGVISVDFALAYDPSVLTARGATTIGTIAESWGEPYYGVTAGQIIIPIAGTTPLTGSGILVNISFHVDVNASIGSITELNITNADLNEGGVPANSVNGVFEVVSLNDPPAANDQSVTTSEDTSVPILLTGSDPDGDPLIYTLVSNPSNGSLSGTAPNLIYTPNSGFSGNDSFTFKVNDGTVDSNIATVSITVEPLEDVSTMVQVNTTNSNYDDSGSQLSMLATWTNISTSRLSKPLLMVIEKIKPSSIKVVNADGTTPVGKPYYDYSNSVGDSKLDPGEMSEARQIVLSGPGSILTRMKFTFDVSCWAHIDGSAADSMIASSTIAVNPIEAPGWSLISLPVQPSDTDPRSVLSSIDGKYSSIWAYDPDMGWSTYAPGAPSDLQKMEPGEGYWVKMQKQGTLMVQGNEPNQTRIRLKGGAWNLVGYSSQDHRSAEECMSQVADAIYSVWQYDPETGWSKYTPGGVSDLGDMEPGYGYWIEANRDCIWDVNAIAPAAAPPLTVKSKSSHVSVNTPGMPYRIWGDVEIDGMKMMEADDPIVILKANDKVYSSYKLGTVESYGDSYVLDIPADITNSVQAEILVQLGDKVIESGPIPPGRPGQILRFDLSVKFSPKSSMLYQNYPNPFNPETWIPYELSEASNVRIEIYSLSGQLVRTLDLGYKKPDFYTRREGAAYWDGRNGEGEKVASGIYFYTIKADGFSATRKMTVLR